MSRSGRGCPAGTNASLQSHPFSGVCVASDAAATPGSCSIGGHEHRASPRRRGSSSREHDAIRVEAGVEPLDVPERPHEQAGGRNQHQRQRELAADQRAQPARSRATDARAGRQRARRIARRSPTVPAPPRTAAPVPTETAAVKPRTRRFGVRSIAIGSCGVDISRTSARLAAHASADPERPAGDRQHQAFGEELAHDAPAPGAEGQPQGHLALARRGARQEQAGDVGAGDQQHDADDGHQHDAAASGRCGADTTSRSRPAEAEGLRGHVRPLRWPASAAESRRRRGAARPRPAVRPAWPSGTPSRGRASARSQKLPAPSNGAAPGSTCGSAAAATVMSAVAPTVAPVEAARRDADDRHRPAVDQQIACPMTSSLPPNCRSQ